MTEGDSPSVGWMKELLPFDRNQSMALLLLPLSLLYPSLYSKELSLQAQRVLRHEWQCVGVGDQSYVIIVQNCQLVHPITVQSYPKKHGLVTAIKENREE